MSDIVISFAVLGLVVALFMSNRVPVGIVAIGAALSLWATGVLTLEQVLAGFGDPTVLFIAALFVVSEGLDATGVTAWAGQQLIDRAGEGRSRLITLMMLLVAVLTALISVNGAVAALLPVVVVMAVRLGRSPSQLLMPLVFGAHAGSMLALTGTPVNVIVSDALVDAGQKGFGFFEFALAGVPLLAGSILFVVFFGEKLLPNRAVKSMPSDLSRHARTLVEQYRLEEDAVLLRVRASSPFVGVARAQLDMSSYPTVTVVSVKNAAGTAIADDKPLADGDLLIVRGSADDVGAFASEYSLGIRADSAVDIASTLFTKTSGLAEVVIPPRSALIGESVFPGMATDSGDLIVLAVHRKGEELGPEEARLAIGDTLLLQGTWDALDENLADPEVLVVDSAEVIRRQAVPLGTGAKRAIAVLAFMVIALATGFVPAAAAGLIAACAMVLLGVVSVEGAYRSISWTTVVLVAGMLPLATAMTQTGAADLIAARLVGVVGPLGPYALLAGLFILTATFGQLISNMATALIVIPIALAAGGDLGVSIRPILMTVTVAAAASYLTPVATPVNMMVMGPAGYRFSDYWKLGLPLLAVSFAVAVFLVPLIWPF